MASTSQNFILLTDRPSNRQTLVKTTSLPIINRDTLEYYVEPPWCCYANRHDDMTSCCRRRSRQEEQEVEEEGHVQEFYKNHIHLTSKRPPRKPRKFKLKVK